MHYAAISQPLDPTAFIDKLRADLDQALGRLSGALRHDTAGGVRITTRKGDVWIRVPKLGKQPEPATLAALKREIIRRWGVVDLLDVLKEIDYLTGFTDELTTIATRENLPRERAAPPAAADAVRAGNEHGDREDRRRRRARRDRARAPAHPPDAHQPRQPPPRDHPRRQRDARRARPALVGQRDHRRERLQAVRVLGLEPDDRVPRPLRRPRRDDLLARRARQRLHPQPAHDLLRLARSPRCSQGLLHHCTDAEIEANYTDTHGASVVGFAFCHLLGFRLLPQAEEDRQRRPSTVPTTARATPGSSRSSPARSAGS